jgi:purine-nucleoside phosphorylase
MSQLHIHAESKDIAPLVLLPGDPNRAKYLAETFLENARLYNDNRQLLGYTGTYQGVPVSIQTTGMGCPSLSIVVEEIIKLGAKTLIRIGTTGIISREVKPGELVIAMSASPLEGTTKMYLNHLSYAPTASFKVVRGLVEAAETHNLAHHVGLINTEDAFYATLPEHVKRYEDIGVLSVEMEAAALFLIGKMRKVETGCILVASNYIGDPQLVGADIMKRGIDNMAKVALEAGKKLIQE